MDKIRTIRKFSMGGFWIVIALLSCSKSTDGVAPPTTVYPVICDAPAWSPDGKTIAYWYSGIKKVRINGGSDGDPNQRGIWFISPDGTNKRIFLWGGYSPDWSPDEEKLALEAYSQIFTIKTNGDSLTQLTFKGRNFFPDWSPDGKKIAYDIGIGDSAGIWVMDVNGNNKRRLIYGLRYPDWFSDGSKIVCSNYDIIWVLDSAGIILYKFNHEGNNRDPVFSLDGSKIVFSSSKESPPQIFVMDADGGNLKQLTTEGGSHPAWSPDGKKIVYVRENPWEYSSKQGQLWIMDADGSNKKQLTFDGW